MPRPPAAPGRCSTRMAAYQMVHIMEGVIQRGTATVLRDLDRPLFGKTGTTTGPTNVWFVGGTPDIVAGVYLGYDQPRADGRLCPGRAHRRAGLQAMGAGRAQGPAQGAVRRPAGHPHGADRPGERQARVRRLPDDRGSQVVGDLGGVPARDRAAPLVTAERELAIRTAQASRTLSRSAHAAQGRRGPGAAPRSAGRRLRRRHRQLLACKRRTASTRR